MSKSPTNPKDSVPVTIKLRYPMLKTRTQSEKPCVKNRPKNVSKNHEPGPETP